MNADARCRGHFTEESFYKVTINTTAVSLSLILATLALLLTPFFFFLWALAPRLSSNMKKVNCCSLSISYLEVISGAAGSLPETVVSHKTLHPSLVGESEGKKQKR